MRHVIATLLAALPLAAFAQSEASPVVEPPRAGESSAPAAAPVAPAVVAPPAAPVAGTPAAAAKVDAEPSWSFGAGIGFGSYFFSGGSFILTSGSTAFLVSAPSWGSLVTSLERRLGARTWLVVGASGSYSDERNAWENVDLSNLPAERKSLAFQASAGVRRALTRPRAPVEVSALVLAEGGIVDASFEDGTAAVQDQSGWLAGGSVGFSVERVLVDRLSLRVATPIATVRYAKSETTAPQGVRVTSSGIAARLLLAPSLELRLAF